MEVKVFFMDGAVESHQIPPLSGITTTQYERGSETETGSNSLDDVTDVVEALGHTPDGAWTLERRVISRERGGADRVAMSNGTRGYCIVKAEEASDVVKISVDGEQVWPSHEDGDGDIDRLESLMGEMRALGEMVES